MSFKTIRAVFLLLIGSVVALASCSSRNGTMKINGTDLYLKRVGSGEPVIVVHGGPVLDHSYLLPHLEPLSENYELIFYDQRLSGRSSADVDSSEITLANFVEDIEGIRKKLGLGNIHVLGHSWGGMLAMRYATKYEANLASLTLLNSMPGSARLWQQEQVKLAEMTTESYREQRQKLLNSDDFSTGNPASIEKLLKLSFQLQFYDSTKIDSLDLYIPEDYSRRSRLFGNLMPELRTYDLHPKLEEMKAPTLIIYGSREPAASISGEKLRQRIPNSELVIIEESGHFPFIEKPDTTLQLINNFLDGAR